MFIISFKIKKSVYYFVFCFNKINIGQLNKVIFEYNKISTIIIMIYWYKTDNIRVNQVYFIFIWLNQMIIR
jgi:hypothetical protein